VKSKIHIFFSLLHISITADIVVRYAAIRFEEEKTLLFFFIFLFSISVVQT